MGGNNEVLCGGVRFRSCIKRSLGFISWDPTGGRCVAEKKKGKETKKNVCHAPVSLNRDASVKYQTNSAAPLNLLVLGIVCMMDLRAYIRGCIPECYS